ncbi:carbohydrate ABC transporter permease [Microbacterium sp. NPDC057650]|uniref:carbohydrate ABC transporter permease n=1 Tax=unclassified Microbacterium TaxID=2609290 RepID=UPI00366F031F
MTDHTVSRPRRRRKVRWGINIVGGIFAVVWAFPVYWMVITAIKPRSEVMTTPPVFLPTSIDLQNFVTALVGTTFLVNLRNSVIVVVAAVFFSVLIAFFAAAALTRFRFRGRRGMMVAILVVQMLPSTALLIPTFLIYNDLGLVGTYGGLILAYIATALPFSIWVLRGFFMNIPVELEEAAQMDGASTWRILWSVLFPLMVPGLIASSVFAFSAAWNDYIYAYTFMKDQSMYTLPVWLASFSSPLTGTDYGSQMAASLVFSVPVIVFFLIVQRKLVTGMTAGAVKG